MCHTSPFQVPDNYFYHIFEYDTEFDLAEFVCSTARETPALEMAELLSKFNPDTEYRVRVPENKAHTIFRFANGEALKNV